MGDPGAGRPTRRARWLGLVGLALARIRWRTLETRGRQTWLSVVGVAVAIAMLLLVTGVSLGLLGATSQGTTADYWVVPEGRASSSVVGVESQRLGRVHRANERIEGIRGVTDATPVLLSLSRTNRSASPDRDGSGDGEYVLAIGVVAPTGAGTGDGGDGRVTAVAGMPTGDLTPGDPHYANGSYDGPWTGETVVSAGAAQALGVSSGDAVRLRGGANSNATFRVVAVRESAGSGIARLPVVLVHLSELQALVGATETDSADQILVRASDPTVEPRLAGVYPRTEVLTRSGLLEREASNSQLPLAVAVVTLGVTLVVGTLFVVTSLGFEVAESGHERAVMAAVGVSRSSRALLVAVEALLVAVVGGVLGVALWLVGLPVVNAAGRAFGSGVVAVFDPSLALYGLAIALCIGLTTVPYLLVLGDRTTGTARLGE